MIMQKTKITAKGQVTVPVAVMRKLGLTPGDKIHFVERNGRVEIVPGNEKFSAADLSRKYKGAFKKKLTQKQLKELRDSAKTDWIKK